MIDNNFSLIWIISFNQLPINTYSADKVSINDRSVEVRVVGIPSSLNIRFPFVPLP